MNDQPLTTTGDPEQERAARLVIEYCGIVLDYDLYSAWSEWRCRFFDPRSNPFR